MVNAFVEFVKEYRKKNPALSYKDAMKEAAKVYKKGDKSKPTPPKKEKEGNIKMEISEVKEPKKDRQKKVKKYKKLSKEVEESLGKSQITPKVFNEYVILANVLAGKSAKNSYARHLKMVRRKLNTKKLKPLKEKLDKAKSDSNELINLLDKQKAENIKRPLKTQSRYSFEQNKMNRYRKILGEKITDFKKNPENKGKDIPKKKLEREAETEADELVITELIDGNLKKIGGLTTGKLDYFTAYREYKKKNPKGTKTAFKPEYAKLKKDFEEKKKKEKKESLSRTSSTDSSVSRIVSKASTSSSVADVEPKKGKLTEREQRNYDYYIKLLGDNEMELSLGGGESEKALFLALGRPDTAFFKRVVKQLETINRKRPDDEDITYLLEIATNTLDSINDVRTETKPIKPKKLPPKPKAKPKPKPKPKPKSKEILTDTGSETEDDDTTPPPSPPPSPKIYIAKTTQKTNHKGEKVPVAKSMIKDIEKQLEKAKTDGYEKSKLVVKYLRQYENQKYSKSGLPKSKSRKAVNAIIDSWEQKNIPKEQHTSLEEAIASTKPLSFPSDDVVRKAIAKAEGRASDSDTLELNEEVSNKIANNQKQLEALTEDYGKKTASTETKNNLEKVASLFSGSPDDRLKSWVDFIDALDKSSPKSDVEKKIDIDDDNLTFNMSEVLDAYQTNIFDLAKELMAGKTAGEGFAGVEPINSVDDLEEAKGGALNDLIHRKLIKNNPKVSKQKSVDVGDKIFVQMSKQSYIKPDERKANLEGYTYLPQQSDMENAVYENSKDKKLIIAFRGSAKLKDLKADLGIATGLLEKTSRHDSTEELVKKLKTLFPDYSITLTGHSLGGSLAVSMSSKHNIPAVVFNAGHTIGKSKHKDSDIKFYTKEGDPVSMLGANSYKDVKFIEGSHKNVLKDHSLDNFEEGGSLLGDVGKAFLSQGMDTDATDRVKDAAEGLLKKGISSAVGVGSNMVKNSLNNSINDAFSGGSLVDNLKSKLMNYAKENTKVRKALVLKDIYKLVKQIKNEGFKKDMLKEVGKIALELNELS
jgi:hypothetical protein